MVLVACIHGTLWVTIGMIVTMTLISGVDIVVLYDFVFYGVVQNLSRPQRNRKDAAHCELMMR